MTAQRDQLDAWLRQVLATCEAEAFKVAFGISQQADASGLVTSRRLALTDAEAGALDELLAGGHLKRAPGGFRLVMSKAAPEPAPAAVIPFPARRRTAYITKQAARMAELSATHAEAHLCQQLRLQADTMRRKAVDERTIAREARSLELAIRAELWRRVLTPDRPRPA